MICKACGYSNNDDGQFCSGCGLPLSIEENELEEKNERPVLSKKVPYVFPGEETGFIPTFNADVDPEPEELQGEDIQDLCDACKAETDVASAEETPADSRGCASEKDGLPADGDLPAEEEASDDVVPSSEAGSSDMDDPAGDADQASEDEPVQPTSQLTVPIPSAPLASWDEEFPASSDTAVMPEVLEGGEDSVNSIDDGPSDSDRSASSAGKSQDKRANNAAASEAEAKASESDPEAVQDLSAAKTVKMERIPSAEPSSTAVIPSIDVSGPKRYTDSSRKEKPSWLTKRTVGAIVVAVIALLVLALLGIRSYGSGLEVPDVVGMQSQEARARLESSGFEVQVNSKVVEDADPGSVVASNPKAGTKRGKGTTINLTIAASQVVPDVAGVDLDTATTMLEEQGAKNIQVKAEASNQPENTVTAVSPKAGSPFAPDDEIVLTVATSATMPDVVGMSESDAKGELEKAGYKAEVKLIESEDEAGKVLATDPEPGELAILGSTVKLEMAFPGPSSIVHVMDYFELTPQENSDYLQWKDYAVVASYSYPDEATEEEYASQVWGASDGSTVSFTPAPYIEDRGLDGVDFLGQGLPFQGVRVFVPAGSSLSLGSETTMAMVEKYMEACGLQNLTDSCTASDLVYNDQSAADLGVGDNLICAQGEMDGRIWTILITDAGTYIGAGGLECYPNMNPICDAVAVNEILTAQANQSQQLM